MRTDEPNLVHTQAHAFFVSSHGGSVSGMNSQHRLEHAVNLGPAGIATVS